jgi:hypothetical protein
VIPGPVLSGCLCPYSDAEWEILRSARLAAPLPADVAGSAQRDAARAALAALPPSCQLGLLRDNVWLLKPSLNGGGNGRGILLLDRLPAGSSAGASASSTVPALLLAWVASVGRSGSGGLNDMKHGCLLQKAVERPHLLNRELLIKHWPTGYPLPSQPQPQPQPQLASAGDSAEQYKYNWRVWVLGSLAALPSPAAFMHAEGYIDMCGLPYTPALVPGAQVSNQMGGHAERGYSRFQRQWDVPTPGNMHFTSVHQFAYPWPSYDMYIPGVGTGVRSVPLAGSGDGGCWRGGV